MFRAGFKIRNNMFYDRSLDAQNTMAPVGLLQRTIDWSIKYRGYGYDKLPDEERHLRLLYRDILKGGYKIVSVTQDGDDYIVHLEKEFSYEDGGGVAEAVWRLSAQ